LAVLLAYVKIDLFQSLLDSDLPDDPALAATLTNYFPTPLRERFVTAMGGHRLSREIIATQLANAVINRAGMTFVYRLTSEIGASAADLVRAWIVAGRIFRLSGVDNGIEALDNRVTTEIQVDMLLEVRKLGERVTRWLLRQRPRPLAIDTTLDTFGSGIVELEEALPGLVSKEAREKIRSRATKLRRAGVDDELARHVASLSTLHAGLDIVEVVANQEVDLGLAGAIHFTLGDRLGLYWLTEQITALPRDNNWQSLARAALRDDLMVQQRLLTADVIQNGPGGKAAARVDGWLENNAERLARLQQLLGELRGGGSPDFTMLSVAMRELRALATPVNTD
jgi:glutamate dehydrogenase